jgi:hypothetical protein
MIINPFFNTSEQKTITIGTGTSPVAFQPTYFYYDFGYFGNIYTNIEIGLAIPISIIGIRYDMRNSSSSSFNNNNQTIKLAYCDQSEFPTNVRNTFQQVPFVPPGFTSTGTTIVKNNFTWTVDPIDKWYEIIFDIPFEYNPSLGNLLVIWENRDGEYITGTSSNPTVQCTTDSTMNSYYDYQDGSMPALSEAGTISTERPNIQILIS